MKTKLYAAASALALVGLSAPAVAQHAGHGGMKMPMPAAPAAKKKPAAPAAKKASAKKKASSNRKSAPAKRPASTQAEHPAAMDHSTMEHGTMPMDHSQMDHGSMPMPAEPQSSAPTPTPTPTEPMPMDHSQMDHGTMPMPAAPTRGADQPMPMDHSTMDHSAMGHDQMPAGEHTGHGTMNGAFGPYPMARESSGTAWQPDASEHTGIMEMSGDWTLMGHGVLNLVYDHQSGRRGDNKAFASGMLMGMARRPIGNGTLQFRAMLSPDPLMGKSGYPLLLASGETANGTDRLIDRQHPHDFFMDLSASISQNFGEKSSIFLYGGLPGEPAFGPPAFMHREAIMDSPEAPISHHWLDSTHISFGVLTAGFIHDGLKIEVSRFNGREPDQNRWNIETGSLDSTAVRVSWNPTRTLSLQGSWGHFEDSEQLEPGIDQKRWSTSALYADEIAPGWHLAGTLAWGRKTVEGHSDDAYVAEASLKHGGWTVFGRGEITENRELLELEEHGPAFTVGKVSLGAVRDFEVADHLALGVGGLFALNFVPDDLKSLYGSNNPVGAMGFVRLKIQ